ncbi:hypothetical protein CCAX7_60950 [Capsulimonas corticalis]|uniref:Uncharacterized protein n=1 Tax=Capsulimonas corticalis TaxID=2219043 RepID=A0A402CW60_9BACT|nr:hypothetical protein CCAX7_60950 [Capsulimonas corticalis]
MIYISESTWQTMLKELARTKGNVERVAFLDGPRRGGIGFVTTVTLPDAILAPGSYDVTPAAMSQAGKHLRRFQIERLAQIHTHDGDWVNHSGKDSSQAYSQMPGALSIVLPRHGREAPMPSESGIHIREEHGWRRLDTDEVDATFLIIPSVLDFRSPESLASEETITWSEYRAATKAMLAGFFHRFLKLPR